MHSWYWGTRDSPDTKEGQLFVFSSWSNLWAGGHATKHHFYWGYQSLRFAPSWFEKANPFPGWDFGNAHYGIKSVMSPSCSQGSRHCRAQQGWEMWSFSVIGDIHSACSHLKQNCLILTGFPNSPLPLVKRDVNLQRPVQSMDLKRN